MSAGRGPNAGRGAHRRRPKLEAPGKAGRPGAARGAPPPVKRHGGAGRAQLRLLAGRERSLERRHPWIFSGAVAALQGSPQAGDTVEVIGADGRFLAWAAYSPHSQIRARAWSFEAGEFPDDAWLWARLHQSILRRGSFPAPEASAMRLVHGESDGVPGLIVDRYGEWLVVQLLSAGAERRREAITEALARLTGCSGIYERSDAEVRALEGLPVRAGPLRGGEPVDRLEIVEDGLRYRVDIRSGHKTGFYLDQRANRARLRMLAAGREVLNCFAYTGGFALAALAGGARSVVSVETSAAALALARENAALNGFATAPAQWLERDVFAALRELRAEGRSFDLIVLDPPKFAPTARQALAASRGYKDINMNALRLLPPGGLLATFSCSGGVSAELFQKIVAGAAADAGVCATLLERFQAAPDHPVRLEFPEGEYLKGLLIRRDG